MGGRVSSYRGFSFGDLVEARTQDDGEAPGAWRNAVFCQGDMSDDRLPFAVKWGDEQPYDMYDYNDWVRSGNLRKRGTPGARMQYRRMSNQVWGDWLPLVLLAPISTQGVAYVEIREAPARSDAEIIAKLKTMQPHMGTPEEYARILNGEF